MNKCIQDIHAEFDRVGIKHSVEQVSGKWVISTTINGKSHAYRFLLIKADDAGNDISVRTAPVVSFSRDKFDTAYNLMNSFQQEYRFVKFVMDDDGDVNVQFDFPLAYEPIGPGAVEVVVRITKILDDCYPKMMREIWS